MLNYDTFPTEHMRGGVQRYFEKRIEPGSFLKAVIANDLKESFARADLENRNALYEIVMWFYWEVPTAAWGSYEAYNEWINPSEEKESDRA